MKTITILAFVLTAFLGNSQTVVTQNVTHAMDGTPDNTDGCSYVRLVVDYTISGTGYAVSSANTLLNEGNSTTLSATLPSGRLTITGKKLIISSVGYSYTYDITGGSNYDEYWNNGWCFCEDARSSIILITETTSNITYEFTHPLTPDPCP